MSLDCHCSLVHWRASRGTGLVRLYLKAKREVIEAGFAPGLEWQEARRLETLTAVEFFRESAWVVLSSGLSETVVRRKFPALEAVFHDFDPSLVCSDNSARVKAMEVFGHVRKIESVLTIGATVQTLGTEGLLHKLYDRPLEFLQTLPYMGPATSRHLVKNLGMPFAKPDRHLMRIADFVSRDSVQEMCQEISLWLGEPLCMVDTVLWRWATLQPRHRNKCLYCE